MFCKKDSRLTHTLLSHMFPKCHISASPRKRIHDLMMRQLDTLHESKWWFGNVWKRFHALMMHQLDSYLKCYTFPSATLGSVLVTRAEIAEFLFDDPST